MMKLTSALFFIAVFFFAHIHFCAAQIIKGKVFDADTNDGLVGVTVLIKGKVKGTSTNENGEFQLRVDSTDKVLLFSFMGMKSEETAVIAGKTDYAITLQADSRVLQEFTVGIKRINVYSRRRQENILNVPEAVTAFSSEQIEDAGIKKVGDFVAFTPNVNFINSQNVGNIALTVRGISQVRNGDAPVAYVVDGVTLPSPNSINQELFDIELIEVIKGPQGALYGRNAIGGAIHIVTKKPVNKFENSLRLQYGNGNNLKATVVSSGAIVKNKLLYRLGGFYQNRDGLINNATLNKNVDFVNDFGVRAQLLGQINDNFSVDASVSYSKAGTGAIYWVPLANDNESNNFSGNPVSDILGRSDRKLTDAYLKLSYDMEKIGNLEWISAYSKVDEVFTGDLDFSAASLLGQRQALLNQGFIEEIRLTSKSEKKLRWIVGGFMMLNARELVTTGTVDLASPLAELFGLPAGTGFAPFLERNESNNNTTFAGFGQINYDILSNLEATFSLRYDHDSREQTDVNKNETRKREFSQWQPKFSLSYKPSQNFTLYGQYAQGFRSGGFNAPGITAFGAYYDKETSDNFEIGLKSSLFGDRLTFNLSGFRIDFRNQQVFIVDVATIAQGILNIDKTLMHGAEAELHYKPLPQILLSTGFGLTNTEITELKSKPEYVGKSSPLTPKNTFFAAAQYAYTFNEKMRLMPRISYERKGEMYWHVDNVDFQKAYSLLNARLSLSTSRWSFSAFCNNILNEKYNVEFFAKEFSGAGSDIRWQSQPTTFGAEIRVNF